MIAEVALMIFLQTALIAPAGRPTITQGPGEVDREVEAVLNEFWSALGRADSEQLKKILDWPVTIVEVSPAGASKTHTLLHPAELDAELERSVSSAEGKKGRTDFYGTRAFDFKLLKLNTNVVSASYTGQLPGKPADSTKPNGREMFAALAVLRREDAGGKNWRIVFITVPK